MKLFEYLQKEDLNDEMKILSEYIGIENVRKIISIWGGNLIQIPSIYSHPKTIKRFLEEHKQKSDLELCLITGLTKKRIKRMKDKYLKGSYD